MSEPQIASTADRILDLTQRLIQTRGYSAFSYQDIADGLGIRKASIHYHFPGKADLGIAVVARYTKQFADALDDVARKPGTSALAMLEFYFEPYLQFGKTSDMVCLCGALAGEMPALPAAMRAGLEHFFKSHQQWLAGILQRGAAVGEFVLPVAASKMARLIFAALQGALLVKRATGDAAQLRDVISAVKSQILPAQPG